MPFWVESRQRRRHTRQHVTPIRIADAVRIASGRPFRNWVGSGSERPLSDSVAKSPGDEIATRCRSSGRNEVAPRRTHPKTRGFLLRTKPKAT